MIEQYEDGEAQSPLPGRGEGGAQRRVRAVSSQKLRSNARTLRSNQTEAERRFWNLVRNRSLDGLKFVRQYPIGRAIADFCCRDLMLVIELDGSQHADGMDADRRRSAFLNAQGYSVLRFWNNELLNAMEGVRQVIATAAVGIWPAPGWRYSPATLSPVGERGNPSAAGSQQP